MKENLRKLTGSAMFLSIALVLKTAFSFYIPMFGQNGMSVGVSGIFSVMPSLLYGPVYGLAVSALSDFLGYVLKPMGAYMPLLTLTAGLGGFLRGVMFARLKNVDSKKLRRAAVAVAAVFLILGLLCLYAVHSDALGNYFDGETLPEAPRHFISRLLVGRAAVSENPAKTLARQITFVTVGSGSFVLLGSVLAATDMIFSKTFKNYGPQVSSVLLSVLAAGLLVTTLNTAVLREMLYTSWKALPFAAVWLPRAVEEAVSCSVKAYPIIFMLNLFVSGRFSPDRSSTDR